MYDTAMQKGYQAIQAKNAAEAAHWFEQAIAANPKDAQAKACYGQALCWLGRRDEGIGHLRNSGQLLVKKAKKTKDISLLLGMTEQLQYWTDYAGALELGRMAVQINRNEVRAFQLLTITHLRLNQYPQALETARQAVRLVPGNATLQILLASIEAQNKLGESARKRLERVLQTGNPTPEQSYRARKELAVLLDKAKVYEEVFPHLHAAAAIAPSIPEVQAQDAKLVPAMLAANQAGFDRELLGRWSHLSYPEQPSAPIFVMGFMRSGTTLTQEVLDAHQAVFLADETDFVMAMGQELQRIRPGSASTADKLRDLDEAGIRHLREHYWRLVHARYGEDLSGRRLVDKTTMNTIDLGLINCVFPDGKVIFVIRDPRDVCLSCMMQIMIPNPSTVHLLSLEQTAKFYAMVMNWWRYVKTRLSMPYLELRYEEAVTEFEATFQKVFAFLDLPWNAGVAEFHRHAAGKYINSPSFSQVVRPLYTSSMARWKPYASELNTVSSYLQPTISEYGY